MRYVRRRPRRHRSRLLQSVASGTVGLRLSIAETRSVEEAPATSGAKLFSGLLFLALGLLLFYFFASYDFYVYDVEVMGAEHLDLQEVIRASNVDEASVFYVRPNEAEARLEELLWVAEARVRCRFPNRVLITVSEREVAFVWHRGDMAWGGDGEGRLVSLSQTPEDVLWVEDQRRLPDEQWLSGSPEPSQELIASVLALKEALPEVGHLACDPAYGLTFRSGRGYNVRLGQGRIAHKIAIWRALEAELAARGIQPQHVDIRFPSSPCYGLPEAVGVAWPAVHSSA